MVNFASPPNFKSVCETSFSKSLAVIVFTYGIIETGVLDLPKGFSKIISPIYAKLNIN